MGRWTDEDLTYLKQRFARTDWSELTSVLKRSKRAIVHKAFALGLHRDRSFVFEKYRSHQYSPTEASFRAKASNYKSHARRNGIEFSISIKEAARLLKENCFYCGRTPSNHYNVRRSNRANKNNKRNYAVEYSYQCEVLYNGIDRIDNKRGYVTSNVVTCCTRCNTAKSDMEYQEFCDWICRIHDTIRNIK